MKYRIKDAAKMLGLSPQTLRFYERYGIFPDERIGEGQYRQYSELGIDMLMSLRKCRNCGFTVAQTAQLLTEADGGKLAAVFQERAKSLRQQAQLELRIAESLADIAHFAGHMEERLEIYDVRQRPESYAFITKSAGNDRPDPQIMEDIGVYAGWLPLAKWMMRCHGDMQTDMGFLLPAENALLFDTAQMEKAEHLPSCRSIYTIMQWKNGATGVHACIQRGEAHIRSMGREIAGAPIVTVLWNTNAGGERSSYGEFWFPLEK